MRVCLCHTELLARQEYDRQSLREPLRIADFVDLERLLQSFTKFQKKNSRLQIHDSPALESPQTVKFLFILTILQHFTANPAHHCVRIIAKTRGRSFQCSAVSQNAIYILMSVRLSDAEFRALQEYGARSLREPLRTIDIIDLVT